MNYDTKVDGLQALDRYTLQIRLKETDYNFGYLMAMPNYGAVAREVIEAYVNDTNGHPVGTGPYLLKEWKRSTKIVLEANPDFRGFVWQSEPGSDPRNIEIAAAMKGKKMPQIGRVEIYIIEEQQASWLAFQKDELDLLYMREQFSQVALPDNKVSASLAKQGVTLSRITDPDINYTYFNTTDPEFGGFSKEKIALRRAILMSFDDAELIRVIRKNQAIDAKYPIPPDVVGHDASYRTSIPYDPALANKLLDYRRRPHETASSTSCGRSRWRKSASAFTSTRTSFPRSSSWSVHASCCHGRRHGSRTIRTGTISCSSFTGPTVGRTTMPASR
jgi:ABC-type transport system substrate-binding protein